MDYTKEVVEHIKPILKAFGFKKNGLNWFSENEKIIKIFNVQRSQFGKQIYINIGIKIKSIEPKATHNYPGSHLGFRLDHLVENGTLDFENNIDNKSRSAELAKVLNSNPYSFFTIKGTNEEMHKFIEETGLSLNSVSLVAKKHLGL